MMCNAGRTKALIFYFEEDEEAAAPDAEPAVAADASLSLIMRCEVFLKRPHEMND